MAPTGIPSDLVNFDALPDSALVNIKVLAAICGRSVSSTWRAVVPPPRPPGKRGAFHACLQARWAAPGLG